MHYTRLRFAVTKSFARWQFFFKTTSAAFTKDENRTNAKEINGVEGILNGLYMIKHIKDGLCEGKHAITLDGKTLIVWRWSE